jgi:hypothetical protein
MSTRCCGLLLSPCHLDMVSLLESEVFFHFIFLSFKAVDSAIRLDRMEDFVQGF